jgi:phosphoenolpyruvate carboxykinase (ATP)
MSNYRDLGFNHSAENIFKNQSVGFLIESAVRYHGGRLTPEGALVVYSGKHTGRSAKDKYVVETPTTQDTIDWENNLNKLSPEYFQSMKKDIINYINTKDRLYHSIKNVGANEPESLQVELFTYSPSHSLFFGQMMREDNFDSVNKGFGQYKIYHAPHLEFDAKKYGLVSSTAIAIDLDTKEIIVAGTQYAGEIKKSVFSVMNYILPDKKMLPMHAGANKAACGNVSVFFGLSGTGKTTLSTQDARTLIGDDEHGLSDQGIFNFEGGCYAKTYKLSHETEPEIFAACQRFGALLENVVLDNENKPDFFDKSIAENTRASYPLEFIENMDPKSVGGVPQDMFFLTADAFGVLPPVSKLDRHQAMYYFLSGYTAKLAGTEIGVKEPTATFSTCFGAPFMMRKPTVYAEMLGHYIDKYNIKVWLINTGWTGGAYGVGERFPLKVTRRIIDAIQANELKDTTYEKEEIFNLKVPKELPGVDKNLLWPKSTWSDSDGYLTTAKKLAKMFHENFERFGNVAQEIKNGGPSIN